MLVCKENIIQVSGNDETVLDDFVNLCESLMSHGFPKEILLMLLNMADDVVSGKVAPDKDGKFVVTASDEDIEKAFEAEKKRRGRY